MTQTATILAHCESHDGITTLEAMLLGICRLSERIRELEREGVNFTHDPEKTPGGARVIRYHLDNRFPVG